MKKLLILLLLLVIVVAIGGHVGAGALLKAGVEKGGSYALDTDVHVGGASVSLLIEMASLRASEWTVLWALGATSIMFACFSLSALLARRRSYLFLGGILSSAMSMMFWFGMASMFFPNRASYMIQLYGGLLLFSGYVLYDSQVIVERAYTMNKPDVLADSLKLFTDFMALLRRVLIILMQREQRKDDRRRQQHQPQFRMNAGMMGPTAHSRRSYGYSY